MYSLAIIKFLFICIFSITVTTSIQIDVHPSKPRCIGQELDQEDAATFLFKAVRIRKDSPVPEVTASITDPEGNSFFEDNLHVDAEDREVKRNVEVRGVYQTCFAVTSGSNPVRIVLQINYKSRNSDPSKKVNKDDLPTIENQLAKAEESLKEISKEIEFARKQEAILRNTGESTNSRIQWFSIFSIIILLTASLWQILYLRHFFASKKLL